MWKGGLMLLWPLPVWAAVRVSAFLFHRFILPAIHFPAGESDPAAINILCPDAAFRRRYHFIPHFAHFAEMNRPPVDGVVV